MKPVFTIFLEESIIRIIIESVRVHSFQNRSHHPVEQEILGFLEVKNGA